MVRVVNFHRRKTDNTGDLMSAPTLWFKSMNKIKRIEINGLSAADNRLEKSRSAWRDSVADADVMIIGGGGLLEIDFFDDALKYISKYRNKKSKIIIWGAGHNNYKLHDWRHLKQEFSIDKYGFDLIGVRDFNQGYRWVPCASCMSDLFDQKSEADHNIVVYLHADCDMSAEFERSIPVDTPILRNNTTFDESIRFLASGDLVLTNSYHGMYWATILGRRVIAFPTSSKFYSMKHVTPLCDPSDWMRFTRLAQYYPEALEECRVENRSFADDVLQWL